MNPTSVVLFPPSSVSLSSSSPDCASTCLCLLKDALKARKNVTRKIDATELFLIHCLDLNRSMALLIPSVHRLQDTIHFQTRETSHFEITPSNKKADQNPDFLASVSYSCSTHSASIFAASSLFFSVFRPLHPTFSSRVQRKKLQLLPAPSVSAHCFEIVVWFIIAFMDPKDILRYICTCMPRVHARVWVLAKKRVISNFDLELPQ